MTEFITVATFNFTHEITILKTLLDNKGIPYLFQNENLVAVNPLASIAYGGIDLKVHPNDVLQVKEIIDNLSGRDELRIV